MIPKIIHYCWLSGEPFPELIQKCIESWKKNLPGYEFILWDTNRINIKSNKWLEQAFENKKYAFAADYIRFYALYNYGGIYLDADVEVLRSFNDLLNGSFFIGEEASGDIEAAVIGVEKYSPWVKECLDYYNNRNFIKTDGTMDTRPVPLLVENVLRNYPHIKVSSFQYFSPKNFYTLKIEIEPFTYCIHHFDGKWVKKGNGYKFKLIMHRFIYYFFGRIIHNKLVRLIRMVK